MGRTNAAPTQAWVPLTIRFGLSRRWAALTIVHSDDFGLTTSRDAPGPGGTTKWMLLLP
jgi:hypothetical protein